MAWIIEYRPLALRQLKKLDRQIQSEIVNYLRTRIAAAKNPKDFGKPLTGGMVGLWRYRVRDYRIVCEIQDKRLVVLVLALGHRKTVYDE